MGEGQQMVSAGVHKTNPDLIVPLISCVVDTGTQIIVGDGGFFASDVIVVSGPKAGCRGTVGNERLSKK